MKKTALISTIALSTLIASVYPVSAAPFQRHSAGANEQNISESIQPIKLEVEQTVKDFFDSLNKKDSAKYLNNVAHSQDDSTKYVSSHLKEGNIEIDIIKTQKINDSEYEVQVKKTENGKEYPVIPYDVVLEGDKWKVDPTNIVVTPKEILEKQAAELGTSLASSQIANMQNIVGENENFIVRKTSKSEDTVSPMSFLTYNFGERSVDIYSPGALGVETIPGNNDHPIDSLNWTIASLYEKNGSQYTEMQFKSLSPTSTDYATFSVSGYYAVSARNFNYPDVTGKFNAVW
ncbi:hypothetical protein N0M98_33280 [Paenibacillus doosanensis]|uniref:DUF4878 domain-containing protein n=1 Tax=Paenibacillus konkukensis TaxID=2020716 RepID=A0ABY4RY54_9BACL|nr:MULTISPECIES: hypothetical protein [Paenibacillus]MCS7464957.1 hypothetical protein [Paenibacillus doosanensis]UQZ87601.1 hypothetical protein SK3146_06903 [Paenibacillus konkukensis]